MRKFATAFLALIVAVGMLAVSATFAAESTLAKVKKRGVLIAGVKFDFPPMGFINKKTGKPDGFDVDLVKEIAKKLGVKTKFVQALSKTRIPLLVNGNVDLVAATMTHKRSRDQVIDFSMHYLITGQRFITRKDTGIKNVSQLAGKRVAAVQGGNAGPNLLKVQPRAIVVPFQEHTENLLALKQKKVDAMVTDDILLQYMAKNNPGLVIPGPSSTRPSPTEWASVKMIPTGAITSTTSSSSSGRRSGSTRCGVNGLAGIRTLRFPGIPNKFLMNFI